MVDTGDQDSNVTATVMAIDRNSHAPSGAFFSRQPIRALRAAMAHPPAIDRYDLVSWGNVTRDEIEALIRAGYLSISDVTLTAYVEAQVI